MKLAIVNLTAGGMSGGYIKYLSMLTPHLNGALGIDGLRVFSPAQRSWRPPAGLDTVWFDLSRWGRPGASLGHEVAAFRPDVVFVPTTGWFEVDAPTVVIMRNMEPIDAPWGGSVSEYLRNLLRARRARKACARADRVIAVSEHVQRCLLERWKIHPARVGLVYHGVEQALPRSAWSRPRTFCGAETPFLFTAGSIRPARGLADAIHAMAHLAGDRSDIKLVIAGTATAQTSATAQTLRHAARLRRLAARLGVTDRILWTGELTAAEMAWCFGNCEVFVMTSRAEACPNIALEAMSYGCVSVATHTCPMPEFLQDSARYYQPGDSVALANELRAVLSAPAATLAAYRDAARRRAARFSWEDTARATVGELQQAIAAT